MSALQPVHAGLFAYAAVLTVSALSQAAVHYNLTIVSLVPSKCTHEDCSNQHPFT